MTSFQSLVHMRLSHGSMMYSEKVKTSFSQSGKLKVRLRACLNHLTLGSAAVTAGRTMCTSICLDSEFQPVSTIKS